MNDKEMAARMRLAYTQATVNFPKNLNYLPISNEIYRIFHQAFNELGGREKLGMGFDPLQPGMVAKMTELVNRAVFEIRCPSVPADVTRGMDTQTAKKFSGLVFGLDRLTANQLIAYARTRGVTSDQVKSRRYVLLTTRWNISAQRMANDAYLEAREYFTDGASGESDYR